MQRRAQEVIDRCWQLGDANPILSIHDVGAGGLSNALAGAGHTAAHAARASICAAMPSEEPECRRARSGATRRRSATCWRIRPDALEHFAAICERERCPFAVVGAATSERRLVVVDPAFGNAPVDMDLSLLFGKPPKMTRDVARVQRTGTAFDAASHRPRARRRLRVLQFPAVADKTFLITIGDRTVGGLCARDPMVGPWQVPVADVAVTLATSMATPARRWRWASARRSR